MAGTKLPGEDCSTFKYAPVIYGDRVCTAGPMYEKGAEGKRDEMGRRWRGMSGMAGRSSHWRMTAASKAAERRADTHAA